TKTKFASAALVQSQSEAGLVRIGPKLYVITSRSDQGELKRAVVFRWRQNEKSQNKTLGTWERDRHAWFLEQGALACQAMAKGEDPRIVLEARDAPGTFSQAAEAFMLDRFPALKSAKHRQTWQRTMRATYDKLGHLKLEQITIE